MNTFEDVKQLVHEHDDLVAFHKMLSENPMKKLGIIHEGSDKPGINYTTYSDTVKEVVLKKVHERIVEIEKVFNKK